MNMFSTLYDLLKILQEMGNFIQAQVCADDLLTRHILVRELEPSVNRIPTM